MRYDDYKAMRAFWAKYPPVNVSVALFLGASNSSGSPQQNNMTAQESNFLSSQVPASSVSGEKMVEILADLGVPWLRKK